MKKDNKEMTEEQKKESKEPMEKKQGVPEGANPATHERCVQHLKDQGKSKQSAYAICNAAGAGMKKSQIEQEIEQISENMEKSMKTPVEQLRETIKEIGPEGLKKSMELMSDEQKELLKSVLTDMQKAVEMDKNYAAPRIRESIKDSKYDVDKADDDADEKLMQIEAAQHNHQGDQSPEGRDGHIIKSDVLTELAAIKEEVIGMYKSAGLEYTDESLKASIKKAFMAKDKKPKEKEDKDSKKEEEKEDASEKLFDMEAKEHGTKNPKKLVEAEKKEDKKEKMKKSIDWTHPQARLFANTQGRNHHFNVNSFYDAALEKAKVPTEELKKSNPNKLDINDMIEKSLDLSHTASKVKTDLANAKVGSFSKSSFDERSLAEVCGISEEEAKKILG